MNKTILTTLAIAMTLNSAAFANTQAKEDQQPMNQKQVDRVLKLVAMVAEERQPYRLTVLDEVQSYKQGLEVLKGQLKRANEFRDDASLKAQLSTLGTLSLGAVKYFSFHRVKDVKTKSTSVVSALTTLATVAAGGFASIKTGQAIKATFSMNEIEGNINKAIEEIGLLETELQAIQDLSPKAD